jgi:hypothetical protein
MRCGFFILKVVSVAGNLVAGLLSRSMQPLLLEAE